MPSKQKCINYMYPASRGFSIAWLLAFTKSGRKQLNQLRDRHCLANDFVNAKSHAVEKPLLAGYVSTYLYNDVT